MRHLHFDLAEIEAALAASRAQLSVIAAGTDSAAAQARMTISVMAAFTRQITEEQNRATDPHLISDALASVCANMIRSFVASFGPDEADRDDVVRLINAQIEKTIRFLAHGINGNARGPSFEVFGQEGGTA